MCKREGEREKVKTEKQSLAQDFAEVAAVCLGLLIQVHLCVDCSTDG